MASPLRPLQRILLDALRTCALAALQFAAMIGFAATATGLALLAVVIWFFLTTPSAKDLDQCITAKMFEVPLCPKSKTYVRLSQVSRYMPLALIAAEDGNFYGHKGIDWDEMRASLETNLKKRRFARGGSTLTQQLAKNVYLSQDKSLLRKIREAVIASRIETLYSKNLILEKYLNVVEFGPKIYGIRAASLHYFGKLPIDLDLAESAWLAMLLPSPEKYSASHRRKSMTSFAVGRMRVILNRIGARGKVDPGAITLAKSKASSLFGSSRSLEDDLELLPPDSDPNSSPSESDLESVDPELDTGEDFDE